jgi:WD40 repeat protein
MLEMPEIAIEKQAVDTTTSLHFSPDGQRLASGHINQTVRIWELPAVREIDQFMTSSNPYPVYFGSNGRLLAAGCEQSFYVWQVSDGTLLFSIDTPAFLPLRLHPHEPLLAIGGDNGVCDLWNVVTEEQAGSLTGHRGQVYGLDFSPDGTLLASSAEDGTVRVWQVDTKSEVCSLRTDAEHIASIAFSPDGEVLAAGGAAGTVYLWNVKARTLLWQSHKHRDSILNLAFEPSGDFFASACLDKTVRVWNRESGAVINMIEYPDEVYAVDFSRDGAWLAMGGGGDLQLWRWGYPELVVKSGRFKGAVAKVSIKKRTAEPSRSN